MTRGSGKDKLGLSYWIAVLPITAFMIWAVAQTVIEFRDGRSSVGWRAMQGVIVRSELMRGNRSGDMAVVRYLFSDAPNWSPRRLMELPRESNMTTGIGGFNLDLKILETLQSFCGVGDDRGKISFYEHNLRLKFRCGDRIAFGGDAANPAFAQQYPVGRVVTVYFDPVNPSRSTLERGWQGLSLLNSIVLIAFVVVLLGGFVGIIAYWTERRRRLM